MPLTAKRPTQELVDLVGALGGTWTGYRAMARCPAHGDNDPSLSIRQGDRGILVTCFASGSNRPTLCNTGTGSTARQRQCLAHLGAGRWRQRDAGRALS